MGAMIATILAQRLSISDSLVAFKDIFCTVHWRLKTYDSTNSDLNVLVGDDDTRQVPSKEPSHDLRIPLAQPPAAPRVS